MFVFLRKKREKFLKFIKTSSAINFLSRLASSHIANSSMQNRRIRILNPCFRCDILLKDFSTEMGKARTNGYIPRSSPVSSCFASSSHRAVPKVNAAFCTCRDPRWGLRGSPRWWDRRTPAASTHTRELSPPRATVQQCHPRGATEPSFCSCPSRRPSCRRFSSVLSFLYVHPLLCLIISCNILL